MKKLTIIIFCFILLGCEQTDLNDNNQGKAEAYSLAQEDESGSKELRVCQQKCRQEEPCLEGCWVNEAERKKDPALCAKIQSKTWKESCYTQLAVADNAPRYCQNLTKPRLCYLSVINNSKNAKICDDIPKQEDSYHYCLKKLLNKNH